MPFAAVLWSVVTWIFNNLIVKFLVMGAIFYAVAELTPRVLELISPFIGTAGLSSAFGGLPAGVWFFLDFFALDVGLPLILSAYMSRFLIRRIPVIG